MSSLGASQVAIIDNVNKSKRPVVITRRGKPIAELVPVSAKASRKEWLGSMKDTFEIVGDITGPAIDLNE